MRMENTALQSLLLTLIMNADWYIRNNQINKETGILTVIDGIRNHKGDTKLD
jgi:hypothetical protein